MTAPYGFGETRVATLALLTFTGLSRSSSCGVVTTTFSGHAVSFRSSPTVFGEAPMSVSSSTRILSGRPPRAMWSAAMLFGLVPHECSLLPTAKCGEQPTTSSPCRRALGKTPASSLSCTTSCSPDYARTAWPTRCQLFTKKKQRVHCPRCSFGCLRSANQSQSRSLQRYE